MNPLATANTNAGDLVWAHQYVYDGLGRVTQDTISTSGVPAYTYSGNTTTITPPTWNDVNAEFAT